MIPPQNVSISTPKFLTISMTGKVHLQGIFRRTGNPFIEIFFFGGHGLSCLLHLWQVKAMKFEESEKLM